MSGTKGDSVMRPTTAGLATHESLKAIAERLRERYRAERVFVYGSVARGTPTEHSDIDLLVVAPTKERFYERMGSVLAAVRDISLGLPLAPIVLTPEELLDRLERGDQFIQEIVQTGVEL
jgi:predicted nucleotidyltransferase